MRAFRKTLGVMVATLAIGAVALTVPSPAAQAVDTTSDVVLSEVYGGGGNSGAQFTNDFIELYNCGTSPIDVTGWSVQHASSTATTWTNTTALSGTVPAGGFYLIQEAAGTTVTDKPLPGTPNAIGTINMSGSNG